MQQQGQVFKLKTKDAEGQALWAYRYRIGGRGSKRIQRGGFRTEREAREALERALESVRRDKGVASSLTLSKLVAEYLAQHEADKRTIEKLRWLLGKAIAAFGDRPLRQLTPPEIAAWRMTIPPGHRFEATQALRQVLARAVVWQMLAANPARLGVDYPQPPRKEQRPFESWSELRVLADRISPRYGPLVLFAAATGLRPEEWIALERADLDRRGRVLNVRRTVSGGEVVELAKTERSRRQVPLSRRALAALDALPPRIDTPRLWPAPAGGLLDIDNWRRRTWAPAIEAAGVRRPARIYDLRSTFASDALVAGISVFELARIMGTSVLMIERHYGALLDGAGAGIAGRLDALDDGRDRDEPRMSEEDR
jgi:integrase